MTRRRTGAGATTTLVAVVLLTAALVAQQKPAVQKAPPTPAPTSPDVLLVQALHEEEVEGRLQNAIAIYQKVMKAPGVTRAQAGRAQFRIGACYERLGLAEARKAFEAVIANYADQAELAAEAKARLAALAEPAARGTGPMLRQIWATRAGVEAGRISPDGRSLVGIDSDTGDLVIRSVATGQIRRLTSIRKDRSWLDYAQSPVWSRDGSQIAYNWEMWTARTLRGPVEFRIADVASGTSRAVPLDARFRSAAPEDWSPDGRRVLVRLEEGPPDYRRQHLAWVPTSGGPIQLLASAAAGKECGPAFLSPDGAWIVTRIPTDDTAFSVIPAQGGPRQTLLPATASDVLVGWTADGTHVLFMSPEDEFNNLVAVSVVDGRAADRPFIAHRLQACSSLGVSRAGALLCQSTQETRNYVYRASFDVTSGQVGAPFRVDTLPGQSHGSVSWSPDGRRLAYVSWPDGKPAKTLSIWSAQDGQTRSFSLSFGAGIWGWRPTTWSADGRWVYVGGGNGLYRVDIETGAAEAVVPPSAGVFTSKNPNTSSHLAAWSPDARVVYKDELTKRPEGAQGALVAHRLADHSEWELFRSGGKSGKLVAPGVSPDGSQLAFGLVDFTADTLSVMVVPAAGGPAKTFATLPYDDTDGLARWTPDGRSFVFIQRIDAPGRRLLCDVTTGVVTKLTHLASEIAVSPDGKEIAYVAGGSKADRGVWMLENFMPKQTPAPQK